MAIHKTIAAALTFLLLAPAGSHALSVDIGATATRTPATTSVKLTPAQRLQARIDLAKDRAVKEIDRRTSSLSDYNARIQLMVRLTAEQKTNLEKFIQSEIVALSSLKTKILAAQDLDTLKTDIKSITQRHRIYLLVMPQAHITVAADRIQTAVEKLSAIEVKFASRISQDKAAGKDVAAFEALDGEMKSSLASARELAASAIVAIADLTPDNGDKSIAASNREALQGARSAVTDALKSLSSARSVAASIAAGLKGQPLESIEVTVATSSSQ